MSSLPMPKQYKLGLVWGVKEYQVKTITNSTRHKPGEWLSVEEVQKLCDDPAWDVTIADDQTFQAIVGALTGAATQKLI